MAKSRVESDDLIVAEARWNPVEVDSEGDGAAYTRGSGRGARPSVV